MGKKTSELGQNLQKMMKEIRKVSKPVTVSTDNDAPQTGSSRWHVQKPAEHEVRKRGLL